MRSARVLLALVVAAAAAISCRGALGIEDLALDAGGEAGIDSGGDTGPSNGSDAGGGMMDAGGPSDDCAGKSGLDCHACCRMSHNPEQKVLDVFAAMSGCTCGAGTCQMPCMDSVCTGDAAMPPMTCGQCLDNVYEDGGGPSCAQAFMRCDNESDCRPASMCHRGCR